MLSKESREVLQNLINLPGFETVEIADQKLIIGERSLYSNTVRIHAAAGADEILPILNEIPGMNLRQPKPYSFEHSDYIALGQIVSGKIEEADIVVWMIERKVNKKAPALNGGNKEIHQADFTTNEEVVANA